MLLTRVHDIGWLYIALVFDGRYSDSWSELYSELESFWSLGLKNFLINVCLNAILIKL